MQSGTTGGVARLCLLSLALFLSLVPCAPSLSASQVPALSAGGGLEGYSRRVWQTQDGLPEETVQSFAQTPDRYLWIGTSGGLVRFDGAHFVVFNRENTPALRDNSIFSLMVSRDGALWIGSDGGGLARYSHGSFRSYSYREGLTNDFVRALCEDRNGQVWVGTDEGLFRIAGEKVIRIDGRSGVLAVAVHAIREDRRGRLWVGGSSLLMLQGNATVEYSFKGGFGENRIKSILETNDETIWVGTVSGLERKERDAPAFSRVREVSGTVRALQEEGGELWIGTIGGGIMVYRTGRFAKVAGPEYLPSQTILSFFEDLEQNLWVGTQTGLLRLSRTSVSTLRIPDAGDSDFSTISQDRDGAVWVASTHLYRFVGGTPTRYRLPAELAGVKVRNTFRDRSGALWVGTDGDGVFRITFRRSGSVVERYTTRQGLLNDFIRAFLEAGDGSIWIGTDEGVSRWRAGTITNYGVRDGLCYFSIRALLEDRNGDIWIGTDRGVSRLHAGAFVADPVVQRLRNEKVWAIHEDPEGGLWLGTRGGGLFRWKDGKLALYTTGQGLASNSIYHILEDPQGNFWMSGPNGISSISRRDLDRMAQVPSHRFAVRLYGISDGLETTQMHGGTQPAGCLTAGGEVWFPSNKGPVRILPHEHRTGDVPSAVVERIIADGREAPVSGRLTLPPGAGKLDIYYSAIRLRSQERIRFKYILEGFDKDWSEAYQRREAFYTNLPPGEYRFRVAAFEMSDPGAVSEASVIVDWRPHFYRTVWFYLACFVSLAMAVWVGHEFRMRQARDRFEAVLQERGRLAREVHDTLIQGCGSVSALLEASATVGDAAPEMKSELLECARNQMRVTIDEARRAIWNLRQTRTTVNGIGAMLSQIAQQVSADFHIPVTCETTGSTSCMDQQLEHELLMVAREALHNGAQHSGAASMQVRLHFEAHRVHMRIADDGCGFDPAANPGASGAHYGVIGMRERIERLGGRFALASHPGRGTRVDVTVLLGNAPQPDGRGARTPEELA